MNIFEAEAKMKTKLYLLGLITTLAFIGCDVSESRDITPPAPPKNLYVYTGDSRIDITWDRNRERDLAGYNVYYSYSYNGEYRLLGSTKDNYFIDYGAINGEKYFYGVAAYDYNGNESDLSVDYVYGIGRPEGFNEAVDNSNIRPNTSGYDFSAYKVVHYDDADFFFTVDSDGSSYIDIFDDTYIVDMGATKNIYDIQFAPDVFPEDLYLRAIPGHTYVIWTWDNHFAKIRVSRLQSGRMVFDWAYQLNRGETMLKHKAVPPERKERNMEEIKKRLEEREKKRLLK